jgi:hypothetical protein
MRSQTIGFYIKTLKNPIAKNPTLPPLVCWKHNSRPTHFSLLTRVSKPIYTCKWMCVCVWVRENSPPHLCLWVRERTHPSALPSNHTSDNLLANSILDGRTNGHTRFNAETLNPKPEHTQEDTHYTEWYQYPKWFFLALTVLTTHPRVYPLHWGTLFSSQTNRTLSDTHDTEGYPWHWVIPITLSSSSQ